MKHIAVSLSLGALLTIGGCSDRNKAPDVSDNIHRSLDQAGFKEVSVNQDRDKGVVTLKGAVPSDAEKMRAESIAKGQAAGEVVANEIAVVPPGNESAAKTVNSDIDKAIDKNLDAALVENRLNKTVKYSVKNGVVTLKGHVDSQAARSEAAHIAASVPNVAQVVNELEVRHNRATSSR
ncbi:MAG TPA: BON domain-containing protein [Bryobacteraceae bacterium]|jgi:osmotically-inducible protein OsmY|nr:BON domain-containing protein [Bryobacteraceae bacterium]